MTAKNRLIEIQQEMDQLQKEYQDLIHTSNPSTHMPYVNQCSTGKERSPEQLIDAIFTYHPVRDETQKLKYEIVRDAAKAFALVIWKSCPPGADRTAAIRKLREAVMTANASIALDGLSL